MPGTLATMVSATAPADSAATAPAGSTATTLAEARATPVDATTALAEAAAAPVESTAGVESRRRHLGCGAVLLWGLECTLHLALELLSLRCSAILLRWGLVLA
jgi:hypothetical protein